MPRVLRALYTNTEIMRKKAREEEKEVWGGGKYQGKRETAMCNSSELTPPFPSPLLLAGSVV